MSNQTDHKRLPDWLRKRLRPSSSMHSVKTALRSKSLHTVCEEASCPNLCECFERGTATIMIMGDTCTRNCGFCNIRNEQPKPLDPEEPRRVAEQIDEMGLKHAVITSVTRDDLPDGGASHFAATIQSIRELAPETTIEVLTPDFEGREGDIKTVCDAKPDIFNHNLETVKRLTAAVRDKAEYQRSLEVLRVAKACCRPSIVDRRLTKSGLMVGLGETRDEVEQTLRDLRAADVDIVTIGQYLRPSRDALPVVEYIEPEVFRYYEKLGLKLGFKHVFAGPFVRSSYLADQVLL